MLLSLTIIWFLAGAAGKVSTAPTLLGISPIMFWLVLGAVLCSVELFLPTAFTAFTMGLSALMVGLLSTVVRSPQLQVLIWLLLSTTLIFLSRRLLPKRKVFSIQDATEGETMTEIPPGETGRVLYEGNSWRARCSDEKISLSPNQKVYVVGRQGITLIVMPENLSD
ncbi:NfeD family protein [Argonema antarcticum]|uniref:NfeD family protein n=1 Tax=Argonema antarcticum TaxID=2942763 RepID=UPI002012AA19|nr:NfeD family protein [Argonema antarcticum]MCL1472818.1 NfeD family protein [Argonema antarcticum A004/B2]